MFGFSVRHQASWAWYRDLFVAVAFATVVAGIIAGLTLTRSHTVPAASSPVTTTAPLNCRATGVIGQDGNTASAVASHLAGRRGAEALHIMQSEGNDALDLVHPGQVLSVPIPC